MQREMDFKFTRSQVHRVLGSQSIRFHCALSLPSLKFTELQVPKAMCLNQTRAPKHRQPGARRHDVGARRSSSLKPTFFDRWGKLILLFTVAMMPGIFYCAGKAVQSNVNKVEDWLPKTFNETKQLSWFRKHFASDQFVVISWEGCRIGHIEGPDAAATDDPRIERLAQLLVADRAAKDLPKELQPVKPVSDEWKRDASQILQECNHGAARIRAHHQ